MGTLLLSLGPGLDLLVGQRYLVFQEDCIQKHYGVCIGARLITMGLPSLMHITELNIIGEMWVFVCFVHQKRKVHTDRISAVYSESQKPQHRTQTANSHNLKGENLSKI